MLFLPIRAEKDTVGMPNVTIGLIVLNLIIWIFTNNIVSSEYQYLDEIHHQMVKIEESYIYELFQTHPEMVKMDFLEIRELILKEKIIPVGTEDYQHWLALYQEFNAFFSNRFFTRWGFVPNKFNVLKLFFAMFLHGGFLHVFGNMLFLWIVGCNMEDDWGWKKFLGLYFLGGIVAALFHWAADPGSYIPMIGASGAVAGIMGAYMVQHFKTKIRFFYFIWLFIKPWVGTVKLAAGIVLPFWFVLEYISARSGAQTGTAHWAHVGGFVLGGGVGFLTKFFSKEALMDTSQKEVVAQNMHKLILSNLTPVRYEEAADLSQFSYLKELSESEPYNYKAQISLGKIELQRENYQAARMYYNRAIETGIDLKHDGTLFEIFNELKKDKALKRISDTNLFHLARMLERRHKYQSAAKLYAAYVKWHPSGEHRAKCIHRAAILFRDHLDNEKMASNAMALLQKEYPEYRLQTIG